MHTQSFSISFLFPLNLSMSTHPQSKFTIGKEAQRSAVYRFEQKEIIWKRSTQSILHYKSRYCYRIFALTFDCIHTLLSNRKWTTKVRQLRNCVHWSDKNVRWFIHIFGEIFRCKLLSDSQRIRHCLQSGIGPLNLRYNWFFKPKNVTK